MSTSTSTTRLAILHYATVHLKDLFFTRKLLEVVCNDLANPEVVGLLEEFLMGSTYGALKRQIDTELLRFMPFTCAEPFTGQAESTTEGERLSSISYTHLGPVTLGARSRSKTKTDPPTPDSWDNLAQHVHHQDQTNSRFSSQEVQRDIATSEELDEEFVRVEDEEAPSFLKRFTAMAKSALMSANRGPESQVSPSKQAQSRPPSRSELALGHPPLFLFADPDKTDLSQERLVHRTSEILTSHLRKFLKRDSRSKIKNIAAEYVGCQMQQSRQLVHLMCNILVPEDIPASKSLCVAGTRHEYKLFLLLERYYLALEQQAFPYPPGFSLYFTCLGFRCLQFRLFIQYVDHHILRITPEFMKKMLDDLGDDDEEHIQAKHEVLLRLPPAQGVECARQWSHPVTKRFLAEHYTNACLTDGVKEEFEPSFNQETTPSVDGSPKDQSETIQEVGFPPLTMLVSLLEKKASRQSEKEGGRKHGVDKGLLEEVGLAEFYSSGAGKATDILTFG